MLQIDSMEYLDELVSKNFNVPYTERQFDVTDKALIKQLIKEYRCDFAFGIYFHVDFEYKYKLAVYKDSETQKVYVRDDIKHNFNEHNTLPIENVYDWCFDNTNSEIQNFVNDIVY